MKKTSNFSSRNNSGDVYYITRGNSVPLVFKVSADFVIQAEYLSLFVTFWKCSFFHHFCILFHDVLLVSYF